MDPVEEIKARLPIEELVGQYRQLTKKGRNFVCLCPFHNDTHPSMVVSPDKGIAYCFACNAGGDIFSFYQSIEGVDFRQALKDLAERTGVALPETPVATGAKKDEKERLRDCLESAQNMYRQKLKEHSVALQYLGDRGVPAQQIEEFGLGVAPDSFSETYEHLLKEGFSRSEILGAGLAVQKDLKEGRIYDRFRNRLMFPIHDAQGRIVGFGGRTLGEGDAKYINSSEGPLYNKSAILYGYHAAKEAMRSAQRAYMVEGYFDVLACHRSGIHNVVAVSGTALTSQHAKLLRRSCDTVVLCLDQDQAGRDAAERAFHILSAEGLHVRSVAIVQKDPAEAAQQDPHALQAALESAGKPYIESVLEAADTSAIQSTEGKRMLLQRVLPLLASVPSAVEQEHYLGMVAAALHTSKTALYEDLARLPGRVQDSSESIVAQVPVEKGAHTQPFSKVEIALGLLLLYPSCRPLIRELIEPAEGFAASFYAAIAALPAGAEMQPDALDIAPEYQERLNVLLLFCEEHNMHNWSEVLAYTKVRKQCACANHENLQHTLRALHDKLLEAQQQGRGTDETQIKNQYQQVLKLARLAASG
ncbi:MAG: DNA primase [Candidatus Peribacteraceae bacterium]|nr:DNA primase [Candidatus Peribacteria bacterium]